MEVEGSIPTPGDDIPVERGVLDLVDLMWTTYGYAAAHPFPSNDGDDLQFPAVSSVNYSAPSESAVLRLQVKYYLHHFIIPVIFGVGILGNVANLFLLTSHRLYPHRRQTTPMERSAVTGLKTLAASDLLFCVVGFSASFIEKENVAVGPMAMIGSYYRFHHPAFLNVFLFTSTLLIMLISVERYVAICHPFRAAALIRVRRTVCAHLLVFVVSALLNIPLFLRYTIMCSPCQNGSLCYFPVVSDYFTPDFMNLHNIIWFTFGTFVPLALILASNALLIRELYEKSSGAAIRRGGSGMGASVSSGSSRSRSINITDSEKTSTTRLTLTLFAVVVCFVLFVCPSMFIQFFRFVVGPRPRDMSRSSEWIGGTEAFLWAVSITNLTQTVKFSSNFLLYCAINRTFRQTFARLVRGDSCRTQNEQQIQQQQQMQKQQLQQQENGGKMKSPGEVIQMIEK